MMQKIIKRDYRLISQQLKNSSKLRPYTPNLILKGFIELYKEYQTVYNTYN